MNVLKISSTENSWRGRPGSPTLKLTPAHPVHVGDCPTRCNLSVIPARGHAIGARLWCPGRQIHNIRTEPNGIAYARESHPYSITGWKIHNGVSLGERDHYIWCNHTIQREDGRGVVYEIGFVEWNGVSRQVGLGDIWKISGTRRRCGNFYLHAGLGEPQWF